MVNPPSISDRAAANRGRAHLASFAPLLLAFAISIAATTVCYIAAGPTLGLYIGGIFVAATLTPPVALIGGTFASQTRFAFAIVVGIAVPWIFAVFHSPATPDETVQLFLMTFAMQMALMGVASFLVELKINPIPAAAASVATGLAWLTWPIWLLPQLTGDNASKLVSLLVRVHPPLVANGVLAYESAWTQRMIAYHLTSLNQDVPITLPTSATAAIILHLLFGLRLGRLSARFISRLIGRRRR